MEEIKYNKPSKDFAGIKLGDKRLDKRLEKTVERMTEKSKGSILRGCGKRHDAKAFYALLTNEKFSMEKMREEAAKATVERIKSSGERVVLVLQDTADINLKGHKKTEGLGYCSEHIRGVQLHSCLALTPNGTPLGLLWQQYGTREKAKSELSEKEQRRRGVEEKESYRWLETARKARELVPKEVTPIVICDREGDFYELYADMNTLRTSSYDTMYVVRVTHDRQTDSEVNAVQQLRRTKASGEVEIAIPRDTRANKPARTAKMEVAYCCVTIARPKRTDKTIPKQVTLNLVRITEIGETDRAKLGIEPIEWILATNIPLDTAEDALRAVDYYVQRWKIERFHYVLKSGCQVEKIQQRTYGRILPVILICSVIAVFILAMTYLARNVPDAPCDVFLEEDEWKLLYRLVTRQKKSPEKPYPLKIAVDYLGELGSYRHSPSDGDYGVKSIWQGLLKLFDAFDILDRLMGQV
jgi:hypothetical protein